MLINYIKAALNSWYRRKIFTSLTILGMALSIMLTTCAATLWALIMYSVPPESNKEEMRIMSPEIKDNEQNRALRFQEVERVLEKANDFYDLSQLGLKEFTVFSYLTHHHTSFYQNHIMYSFKNISTDDRFFNFFNFNFISGKSYKGQVKTSAGTPVVITKKIAQMLFGTTKCVGEIFGNNEKYLVTGVVQPAGPWSIFFQREMFILTDYTEGKQLSSIAYYFEESQKGKLFQRKLDQMAQQLSVSFNQHSVQLQPHDYLYSYISYSGLESLLEPIAFILMLVPLLLLPATCMVNLFRGLMAERIQELGIRKSFGARVYHIISQFIIECILVTVLSGLVALLLSILFWKYILTVDLTMILRDVFNWRMFLVCLVTFTFMGALIGFFSSVKLARGSIVKYLSFEPS